MAHYVANAQRLVALYVAGSTSGPFFRWRDESSHIAISSVQTVRAIRHQSLMRGVGVRGRLWGVTARPRAPTAAADATRSLSASRCPRYGGPLRRVVSQVDQRHHTVNSRRSFVSLKNVIPMAHPSVPREHRPPPPPLPEPHFFHLEQENATLEYIDIQAADGQADASDHARRVTMVLIHGAPGTYQDFRHIIPLLQQQEGVKMRIIGINLPGFGRSTVDAKRYIDHISAVPAAKLTLQVLRELCGPNENVFVMGHSFGAHAAFNLTALNQERQDRKQVNFKGMVLLAPAGCRPHRVLRPKQNAVVIDLLRSSNPLVASTITKASKFLYTKMLGFSSDFPASHFVAGIVRAGTTDFQVIADHVLATKTTIPSFIAWSSSDEYMEDEIPMELARMCHPGPRFAFTGGGHNIQKTRADFLADEVSKWVQQVLLLSTSDQTSAYDKSEVQIHP